MDISQIAPPRAQGRAQAQNSENSAQAQAQSQIRAEPYVSEAVQQLPVVSIGFKERPLALLLSSVLNKINDFIAADLEAAANQKQAYEAEQAATPGATAERIAGQVGGFFDSFMKQHAGEGRDVAVQKFMEAAGKGIDQGFAEARDVLNGMGALEGDNASSIDQTYALVQQGLANFREQMA